jgi:phosphate butyryltransferase
MAITNFEDMLAEAKTQGPKTVVAVGAAQDSVLSALSRAEQQGIAQSILIGSQSAIRATARAINVDIASMHLIDEPNVEEAAQIAMSLVNQGKAQIAMKGNVSTALFLRAALDRKTGLRTGCLLSHVAVFDMVSLKRLLLISDAGVNIAPTLEQKAQITQNAIHVAIGLGHASEGIAQPRVAVLASTEHVNPRIPANVDAAALAKMADRKQITGAMVDGPLALDNAISVEAAIDKGIDSPVAGRADVLILPDIEAANVLVKAIIYFARHSMAGIVVGARVPLILPSRAATADSKFYSLALGVAISASYPFGS